MDLARSIQEVTEEVMLRLVRSLHRETGAENLCLAGGVALNCVGNGRILREGPFKGLWIQPSAGDAGGAVGAALTAWHKLENQPRSAEISKDTMQGSLLGPSYTNGEIEEFLRNKEAPSRLTIMCRLTSRRIAGGWQGGMVQDDEFGPRARGARSSSRCAYSQMQSYDPQNKYRASFARAAPSLLRERVSD